MTYQCKAIIVRVDLTHLCISIAYVHKMHAIFIPACMHVSELESSNNCDHWKKNVLQKGTETEKKVWLRVGLNLLLRWLTTVCLRGFYTRPSTRCYERTKAAIN